MARKYCASVLLVVGTVFGQQPNWAGPWASYNSSASPKFGGGFTVAFSVNQPAQLYSYTDYSVVQSRKTTPTTNVCSGLATPFRHFGPVLVLLSAAPCAQTSATAVSGGVASTAILVWKIGKSNWAPAFEAGGATTTGKLYRLAIGRTF